MVMIKINKGKVPPKFYEIKSDCNNYDELHSDQKEKLKSILIDEQNERCAYCNCRIRMESATIEHYIPRHGANGDASKSLDYNNLFVVCNTTRKCTLDKQTCDVKKGDQLLSIDPRIQTHIDTIKYDKRGKIGSYNNVYDDDINIKLNLNSQTLIRNRYSAYDSLISSMKRKKPGRWSKEYVQRTLNSFMEADNRTPYVGFLIYQLQHLLKRF